eukprot:905692-Prorocentrum_minimum.AAC.7
MVGKKKVNSWGEFKFASTIQEEHRLPIYCLHFNICDLRYKDFFATVGSNRVRALTRSDWREIVAHLARAPMFPCLPPKLPVRFLMKALLKGSRRTLPGWTVKIWRCDSNGR